MGRVRAAAAGAETVDGEGDRGREVGRVAGAAAARADDRPARPPRPPPRSSGAVASRASIPGHWRTSWASRRAPPSSAGSARRTPSKASRLSARRSQTSSPMPGTTLNASPTCSTVGTAVRRCGALRVLAARHRLGRRGQREQRVDPLVGRRARVRAAPVRGHAQRAGRLAPRRPRPRGRRRPAGRPRSTGRRRSPRSAGRGRRAPTRHSSSQTSSSGDLGELRRRAWRGRAGGRARARRRPSCRSRPSPAALAVARQRAVLVVGDDGVEVAEQQQPPRARCRSGGRAGRRRGRARSTRRARSSPRRAPAPRRARPPPRRRGRRRSASRSPRAPRARARRGSRWRRRAVRSTDPRLPYPFTPWPLHRTWAIAPPTSPWRARTGPSGSPTTAGSGSCCSSTRATRPPSARKQFCSYRDRSDDMSALDAVVVGISHQDLDSHEAFTEHHGLTVPLLADVDREVARAYGVSAPLIGTRRAAFVIDEDGIVRHRHVHAPRPRLPGRRRPGRGAGRASRASVIEERTLVDGGQTAEAIADRARRAGSARRSARSTSPSTTCACPGAVGDTVAGAIRAAAPAAWPCASPSTRTATAPSSRCRPRRAPSRRCSSSSACRCGRSPATRTSCTTSTWSATATRCGRARRTGRSTRGRARRTCSSPSPRDGARRAPTRATSRSCGPRAASRAAASFDTAPVDVGGVPGARVVLARARRRSSRTASPSAIGVRQAARADRLAGADRGADPRGAEPGAGRGRGRRRRRRRRDAGRAGLRRSGAATRTRPGRGRCSRACSPGCRGRASVSTPYAPGAVHDYMHAKVTVADDVVFVGSFNLSRSGEENAENVLEIADAGAGRADGGLRRRGARRATRRSRSRPTPPAEGPGVARRRARARRPRRGRRSTVKRSRSAGAIIPSADAAGRAASRSARPSNSSCDEDDGEVADLAGLDEQRAPRRARRASRSRRGRRRTRSRSGRT